MSARDITPLCGGCGCPAGEVSLDQAAKLRNVGWRTGPDGKPRCPTCLVHGDGVRKRWVLSSDRSTMYALVRVSVDEPRGVEPTWTCSCPSRQKPCKHVRAVLDPEGERRRQMSTNKLEMDWRTRETAAYAKKMHDREESREPPGQSNAERNADDARRSSEADAHRRGELHARLWTMIRALGGGVAEIDCVRVILREVEDHGLADVRLCLDAYQDEIDAAEKAKGTS